MPSMPPGFMFSFNAGGPAVIAGAQLVPMDDELREALGVRPGAGVLVVRVPEGSPAADAGLRSGDVIRAANGRAVASVGALQRTLLVAQEQGMAAHAAAGDDARAVRLEIVRKGKARTVTLRW
jgi:serine protease Do